MMQDQFSAHLCATHFGKGLVAVTHSRLEAAAAAGASQEWVTASGDEPGPAGEKTVCGVKRDSWRYASLRCNRGRAAGAKTYCKAGDAGPPDRVLGPGDAASTEQNENAKLLMTHPGAGQVAGLAFVLPNGDVSRFPRSKRVACWTTL